jgi:hypothetical protein
MRRQVLCAAAPACLLIGLTPVAASAGVAPPANATATAARLSNLAGISTTGASASDLNSNARAAVISVGGQPVLGTGGSRDTEGESGGALLDTADKLPARARVAPWKASAKGSKSSAHRSSHAEAALARVEAPNVVKAGVLTSEANADHSPELSTGKSVSDAADVTLLDTARIVLLHSEVGSNTKGGSYLVGLNGTKIGSDEELGKSCALDVSGLASLSCLTVAGGVGNGVTTGSAEVLGVQTALGLNPVSAFATTATTAPGSVEMPIVTAPAVSTPVETPRAAAAAPAPAVELPRTGVAAASMASSALAALLFGLGLRRFGRRRSLVA